MNLAKLKSLKKALLYSYQAQTAQLVDGRQFRCLINHDKLKEDYDDKIISIPYKDICLNEEDFPEYEGDIQDINMKVGDTFEWVETQTKWIVIQEILEENAYFRGTIRKAEDEIIIDGTSYFGYLGKWSKGELWHTKGTNSWSEMGYEVVLYITKDEKTLDYFHRFKKLWISNKYWEVQFVNDLTSDTMLIIYLKEAFINEFENDEDNQDSSEDEAVIAAIKGPDVMYPFNTDSFTIEGGDEGTWYLSNNKAKINEQTFSSVNITITSAKAGSVDLIYKVDNKDDIVKTITIKSL